jgi:hypothetical protein
VLPAEQLRGHRPGADGLVRASTQVQIGNGMQALFWTDNGKWLDRTSLLYLVAAAVLWTNGHGRPDW